MDLWISYLSILLSVGFSINDCAGTLQCYVCDDCDVVNDCILENCPKPIPTIKPPATTSAVYTSAVYTSAVYTSITPSKSTATTAQSSITTTPRSTESTTPRKTTSPESSATTRTTLTETSLTMTQPVTTPLATTPATSSPATTPPAITPPATTPPATTPPATTPPETTPSAITSKTPPITTTLETFTESTSAIGDHRMVKAIDSTRWRKGKPLSNLSRNYETNLSNIIYSAVSYHCYKIEVTENNKRIKKRGCVSVPEERSACDVLKDDYSCRLTKCDICIESRCNSSGRCDSILGISMATMMAIMLLSK